ncbi:hypothetical protein, partial [Pseudomonas edaphica]|uniref:hypothetical protein n=1 Tax=Pseudomonas edaphica TaxID=2006980 RepID=UPI00197FBC66
WVAKRPPRTGLLRSPAGASSLATGLCFQLILLNLFQVEAVMASICVWRRLRPGSNSLMKD